MLTVTATHKPPQVVAPAEATVEAESETWDTVVTAGLTALGETRTSLFGYGIRGLHPEGLRDGGSLTGTFTVYADRD